MIDQQLIPVAIDSMAQVEAAAELLSKTVKTWPEPSLAVAFCIAWLMGRRA